MRPSRHVGRAAVQPIVRVRRSTNLARADPRGPAWAPTPWLAGRTRLRLGRPSIRIAALRARYLWACRFALDRLGFSSSRSDLLNASCQGENDKVRTKKVMTFCAQEMSLPDLY